MTKVVCEVRMDTVLSTIFIRSIVQTHSRSNFSTAQMGARQGCALITIAGFPTAPVVWKMVRFQIRTTVRCG